MAYEKIDQILALAKTRSQVIGIAEPVAPQLQGLDKASITKFNADMQKFVTELVTKISQSLSERPSSDVT